MSGKENGTDGKPVLLGQTLDELTALVTGAGYPAFRARQVHHWLYKRHATTFAQMHNLARDFRAWLETRCEIGHAEIAAIRESTDGSKKILFRLSDGKVVESVLMPERDWFTLCLSSQVGCAVGCTFCMTGFGGFQRQMTRSEIVSQVILTAREVHGGRLPRNLVFMGMGEPLLNTGELLPALRVLTDPDAVAVAARRVTVSTSGILPGIERLAEESLDVQLAISLNGSNNTIRSEIMPINRKYPIEDLLETCRRFPLKRRRRVTFEYVLLKGLTDGIEHARELAALLRGLPCKINLIPWNPDPHLPYERPGEESIQAFQQYLLDQWFTVSVRYSKGVDIGAACGQLAGHFQEAGTAR